MANCCSRFFFKECSPFSTTMPLIENLLYGTGLVAAGVGAWALSRPEPAPFHVEKVPPVIIKVWGLNVFPLLQFVMKHLPDQMRRKFVAKMNAPKPDEMKDRFVYRDDMKIRRKHRLVVVS